jgi:hypothetical protein
MKVMNKLNKVPLMRLQMSQKEFLVKGMMKSLTIGAIDLLKFSGKDISYIVRAQVVHQADIILGIVIFFINFSRLSSRQRQRILERFLMPLMSNNEDLSRYLRFNLNMMRLSQIDRDFNEQDYEVMSFLNVFRCFYNLMKLQLHREEPLTLISIDYQHMTSTLILIQQKKGKMGK